MLRQARHDRLESRTRLSDAHLLISWLNKNRRTQAGLRVRKLLQLCLDALDASSAMSLEDFSRETARLRKLKRLERQVNRLLERYVAVRWILCATGRQAIAPWVPRRKHRDPEFDSVVHLMDLFEWDALSRIRVCGCGTYFHARSVLARFCSKTCRERFWENSEERKEQKRRNAREYYRLHKTKNIK